ncbi:electron transfer flavoprotein subunit alpha/FixB family protein [Mesorhizobium sp. CO1-1-8]|uniref:electron transfer flavoprotein subunit alpha/FixB family protein n=1 Tax=Mesorhizobium sp. CO1-1-8 TaxID=2876631 RepID=UPI001CD14F3D|nr:electron transfer flavoprotein subunit alpha/FixB family protein [Mesorhizobium sp. CO1-1-8]MBZ9775030.1 electron transfer flavoprotein subunit alpha/FixB family protein [Mesorhizobium sp. CO1-1-8]
MLRIKRQRRVPLPPGVAPRIDPRTRGTDADVTGLARILARGPGIARRNPHEEKRQRLRRELRIARTEPGASRTRPSAEPITVVVADDVPWIIAVSLPEEPWPDAEREVLGASRRLADEIGGGVVLLRVGEGSAARDVGAFAADRFVQLPPSIDLDVVAERLRTVMTRFDARHIFFSEGGADADLARRMAVVLEDRPATSLQVLSRCQAVVLEAGGRIEVSRPLAKVMTLSAGRFDPHDETVRRESRRVIVETEDVAEAVRDLGKAATSQLDAPLGEARFIVSAGDGVTDWEGFRNVAEVLGATIAGSRQVCDAGHLPRHRQVGASGTLVEARCYLAFGISGAPQHLQGIQRCRHVIAVNTDLHAAMIKRADLAIIADAQAVMPALARLSGAHANG